MTLEDINGKGGISKVIMQSIPNSRARDRERPRAYG